MILVRTGRGLRGGTYSTSRSELAKEVGDELARERDLQIRANR